MDAVGVLDFRDGDAWAAWLDAHQQEPTAAWLRIAKKHSGIATISIVEALEVALCYGWIDGQRRSHDDVSFLQRYSPRRPGSAWSKVNVATVEALTAAGRMRPAGAAQVAAAKADGRWAAAYEPQRSAVLPPDLVAALDANPPARAALERLGRTDRYAMILPLLKSGSQRDRQRLLGQIIDRLITQG
jgi:uncharacterized protein YdeI (YjbR/CyaY-like superfamily)